MAVTGAIVGLGMAAGATAAAVRANKMKTKAKGSFYGGSREALDDARVAAATGADQGNMQVQKSARDIRDAQIASLKLGGKGTEIMQRADSMEATPVTTTGAEMLGQYQPGAVARAQAQQARDANTAASFGAARSGGALGMRNALNANAMTGAQTAQGLAVQRAQEEQALLGQRVAQENEDRAAQADALKTLESQKLSTIQTGAGLASSALGQRIQSATAGGALGIQNQGQFLNQMQGVDTAQLRSDMDYDQRRQADEQRKSDHLWSLAGTLTGGAAKAFGAGG